MLSDILPRGNGLGYSFMDASCAINIHASGFYYSDVDGSLLTNDNKEITHQLEREHIPSVKHPLTLGKIIRRIEFYEDEFPGKELKSIDSDDFPRNFDAEQWRICVDTMVNHHPRLIDHGSNEQVEHPYDRTRVSMTSYRRLAKHVSTRLRVALTR